MICDFLINLLIEQIISSLTNTKPSPRLQPYSTITPHWQNRYFTSVKHSWPSTLLDDYKTDLVNASNSMERFPVTVLQIFSGWGTVSFWRTKWQFCSIFSLPLLSLQHLDATEKCKYWNLVRTVVGAGVENQLAKWQFTYLRREKHFWMKLM